MMIWDWLVTGLCLLLLSFLVWKEFVRANKTWRAGRIAASCIAVICFGCFAFPITLKHQQKENSQHAILLTWGYNVNSVSGLLAHSSNAAPVFYCDEKLEIPARFNASLISNVLPLKDSIGTLHLFGEGLDKDELNSLDNLKVEFHPAAQMTGITSVDWPRKLSAGEKLFVQGTFNNQQTRTVKLVLHGFGTNLDSLTVAPRSSIPFKLVTTPKYSGNGMYSVVGLAGKDTIIKEPVPVIVHPVVPLRLLLLAASPDFENKFLKNWLADNGYGVAIRTTISKNKYSRESLNIPSFSLDRITSPVLEKFDVIVSDAISYASLSRNEQILIERFVGERGLGLIITTDGSLNRISISRLFPFYKSTTPGEQVVSVRLADTSFFFPGLTIEQPSFIGYKPGTKPLVYNKQGAILVSSVVNGRGKVVVSTLSNTYQYVLKGESEAYGQLWSALLNTAAKTNKVIEDWTTTPAIARAHEPVDLKLRWAGTGTPQGQVAANLVYLQQHSRFMDEWRGTFWPVNRGWQVGMKINGDPFWWYAFDENDFRLIKAIERTNATHKYANQQYRQRKEISPTPLITHVEFPKTWFYVAFLIACGFLWIEKKLL